MPGNWNWVAGDGGEEGCFSPHALLPNACVSYSQNKQFNKQNRIGASLNKDIF